MGDPGTVTTVDTGYSAPRFAAAYLVVEGDRAAFIDNGTIHALPRLLDALAGKGLGPDRVDWIIVTHVHLDHAGCTWKLSRACPGAVVLAHPRAARHLVDPARLVRGVTEVYGREAFDRLYGSIEAVDPSRVRALADGESVVWGERTLTFVHTLGHARHHMVVRDSGSDGIFTGDAFGLAYPIVQGGSEPFIFPSSSPPEFDPGEARRSVRRIAAAGARTIFPTHFGPFPPIEAGAAMMVRSLDAFEAMTVEAAGSDRRGPALLASLRSTMKTFFDDELSRRGLRLTPDIEAFLKIDIDLNAAGLAVAVEKMRGST